MDDSLDGHGAVGKREQAFTRLKKRRSVGYDPHKLAILAKAMALDSGDEANDGPDAEENLYMPAGYTYLGQFVDHDLTFDTTSTLAPEEGRDPTNLRTPRFDLDCLYGGGPQDQPYMYDADGATLLYGGQGPQTPLNTPYDLLRSSNGRAIIGDKRNDENSIVNQIQYAFVQFHNHVVQELQVTRKLSGGALFEAARNEVRWAYQRILLDDFLPRIISKPVLDSFVAAWKTDKTSAFLWYTVDLEEPEDPKQAVRYKRQNLPREFVVAAYRFGHSGVRTGYRLSGKPGADMKNECGFRANIFINNKDQSPEFNNDPANSLVGFDPLPANHVIDDWARFFPVSDPRPGHGWPSNTGPGANFGDGGDGTLRLQFAYKLDTTLVDPLAELPSKIAPMSDVPPTVGAEFTPPTVTMPSLALLNLLRGSRYLVQSGQAFAADLPECDRLPCDLLRVRKLVTDADGHFTFLHISDLADAAGHAIGTAFNDDTPLWFYILAEAQWPIARMWKERNADLTENDLLGLDSSGQPGTGDGPPPAAGTQLGPVGGRMVAEVFYGLMDSDLESLLHLAPRGWQPIWGGHGPATMADLLKYAHRPISDLPRPT